MGAAQHQPRNSLDSRRRKGCTLHCLPGLMLALPMPGKLPPPHPLLLAPKHLLTLRSTGTREGIHPKPTPVPALSRDELSPRAATTQGSSCKKSYTASGMLSLPLLLSETKCLQHTGKARMLTLNSVVLQLSCQALCANSCPRAEFLEPTGHLRFQTDPTKLPHTQQKGPKSSKQQAMASS